MNKLFKQIKGEVPSEYGLWVAVGVSVVGAGVSMYSASQSADATQQASQQASDTSLEVAGMNNELAREQYAQTREDQEPWRLAGERALQTIEQAPDFKFDTSTFKELASKGSDFDFNPKEFVFEKDPSYEFRKQEGINALDRSGASRGRVLSGAQDRAVTRYGSNLASTEYQNAFNRHQGSEMDRYNMESGEYNTNMNRTSAKAMNQYNAERGTYNANMNTQKSLAGVGQDAVNNIQNAGQNMVSSVTASNTNAGNTAVNSINASGQAQADMYGGMATSINTGMENALIAYNKPVAG